MVNQRVQKSSSWTPQPQGKSSPFDSRPVPAQAKASTPQDIENQAFMENNHEALGLQLQAKYGTITPQGQERLTRLQAKMDSFRRDRINSIPDHSLLDIPNLFAPRETPQPIQPKLKIGKVGDKYEQEAVREAEYVVQRLNAPQSVQPQQEQTPTQLKTEKMHGFGGGGRERLPVIQRVEASKILPDNLKFSTEAPFIKRGSGTRSQSIQTIAQNDNPSPNQPNCFMAVLTWLHATFGITDGNEIVNSIIDKGGPGPLMQKILTKATKLKRPSEQNDQLRVTSGRIIIFSVDGNPQHTAVSTGPLTITGYNQTHWFRQPANEHSHSDLTDVRWTSKDTIQNSLGRQENVYEIDVDKAAKAVGIARG